MAYQADDGKQFTNRPTMKSHNARLAAAKQGKGPHKPVPVPGGGNPHGTPADSESHHDIQHKIQCPHCGGEIDASEVAANRDGATAYATDTMSGDTEV